MYPAYHSTPQIAPVTPPEEVLDEDAAEAVAVVEETTDTDKEGAMAQDVPQRKLFSETPTA